MEFLTSNLGLAAGYCVSELIVPMLPTFGTKLEFSKGACVCEAGIDTHVVDQRLDASEIGNLAFDSIMAKNFICPGGGGVWHREPSYRSARTHCLLPETGQWKGRDPGC
jgi:hypothetical protein